MQEPLSEKFFNNNEQLINSDPCVRKKYFTELYFDFTENFPPMLENELVFYGSKHTETNRHQFFRTTYCEIYSRKHYDFDLNVSFLRKAILYKVFLNYLPLKKTNSFWRNSNENALVTIKVLFSFNQENFEKYLNSPYLIKEFEDDEIQTSFHLSGTHYQDLTLVLTFIEDPYIIDSFLPLILQAEKNLLMYIKNIKLSDGCEIKETVKLMVTIQTCEAPTSWIQVMQLGLFLILSNYLIGLVLVKFIQSTTFMLFI